MSHDLTDVLKSIALVGAAPYLPKATVARLDDELRNRRNRTDLSDARAKAAAAISLMHQCDDASLCAAREHLTDALALADQVWERVVEEAVSGFLDHLLSFARREPDDQCCPECGENITADDVSVEGFEWAGGKIICTQCFEAGVEREAEDNSQFGMGA